jgi:hypothetical protein
MSRDRCCVTGCVEIAEWKTASVAEFLGDNPGWLWFVNDGGDSQCLCPVHADEVLRLVSELTKMIGTFGVNPMLQGYARERGLLP